MFRVPGPGRAGGVREPITADELRVIASEHLLVRLERHPGALAELSQRLADADVDVRAMHIVNKDERAGIVALETVDRERAREILKDMLVS